MLLIFGLYFAYRQDYSYSILFNNPVLVLFVIALSSWLLISPLKMISLKFKSKLLRDNYPKVTVAVSGLAVLLLFGIKGIPVAVVAYILLSLLYRRQLTDA